MNLIILLVGGAWLYWLLRPVVAERTTRERVEPSWGNDDESA